jgi:hypothetical protein
VALPISGALAGILAVVAWGLVSRFLGGLEPVPAKNDSYFRHFRPGEKNDKRSDSGSLYMIVTTTDR